MSASAEEDIMLRLLHTADWHLGRTFRSFSEEGSLKLGRARLEVLDRFFHLANRHAVDAVLCAGDLFDAPDPGRTWWTEAAQALKMAGSARPIFLLPGNHDPLTSDSVWMKASGITRARMTSARSRGPRERSAASARRNLASGLASADRIAAWAASTKSTRRQ